MRTAASEHISHAQIMSRISATFSALVREQVEVTRRFLESEHPDLETSEMGPIVDLAIRFVERSAEWLGLNDIATLVLELRETMTHFDQLRPVQRQEMIAHCRVALETEERLAEKLRTAGFGALLAHAGQVADAIDQLRSGMGRAKSEELAASRGVIDEATPDLGPQENLLGLTFEIKSALAHQADRIGSMNETLDGTLRAFQTALADWDVLLKGTSRSRVSGAAVLSGDALRERTAVIHGQLQEASSGLRTLSQEMGHFVGLQYSLERRARELDEHLLWEFLDPLDRFVDDMYAAVSRRSGSSKVLTIQTGGVGFEPAIGSILLPLLLDLLASPGSGAAGRGTPEIRVTAAREGLEARIAVEGFLDLDPETVSKLESALEDLSGFACIQGGGKEETSIRIQFPMARSLRSFLIVEAAGQRVALPWSAVERIHASQEELAWSAEDASKGPVLALETLFDRPGSDEASMASEEGERKSRAGGGDGAAERGRPLAVLRSGGRSVIVGFDRIVWRESARLTALPERLCPVREVLGGIVSPDSSVVLVLNPGALARHREREAGQAGGRRQ